MITVKKTILRKMIMIRTVNELWVDTAITSCGSCNMHHSRLALGFKGASDVLGRNPERFRYMINS